MEFFDEVTPEIDTIRLYFYCERFIDLKKFFSKEFQKAIYTVQRSESGKYVPGWEKLRADQRKSWFGKMQIFEKELNQFHLRESVLCVEFSVAKWFNISNGFNIGRIVLPGQILCIVYEQLLRLNFFAYSNRPIIPTMKLLNRCVEVRRLDMSYNFKVNQEVNEVMRSLATCRLNNMDSRLNTGVYGNFETVSFGGTGGSSYKAMFYDKYAEQKHFSNLVDYDNSCELLEEKHFFFKRNLEKLRNVIRFEVQYKTKFFRYHIEDYGKGFKRTVDNMENIIMFSKEYWRKILLQFDEGLKCSNSDIDKEIDIYSKALFKLECLRNAGGISATVYNNLSSIIHDSFSKGLLFVRSRYSQQSFSRYYLMIKKLTGLDIKRDCVDRLPIMRVM